jgi:hypothetical protein
VPLTITHSWIESASTTTSTSYGKFGATWTVPLAPVANDGQTLYFFPGLEQNSADTTILRPVLGWNADFPGAWGIASWNCCPKGITTESTPLSVNSGDKIIGRIQETCSPGTLSCPTWNVTIADKTRNKRTTLPHTTSSGLTFNRAFAGALEVYNVVQCDDYPPGTVNSPCWDRAL